MVQQNTAVEETQPVTTEDTSAVTQTTPQPEPVAAPEPDWKAEAEKHRLASEGFRQQADREAQLRKTAEGRLAKEAETNRRLLRVEEYARHSVPEEDREALDKQAEAAALSEKKEAPEHLPRSPLSITLRLDERRNLVRLCLSLLLHRETKLRESLGAAARWRYRQR